jgi:hypothetical protein
MALVSESLYSFLIFLMSAATNELQLYFCDQRRGKVIQSHGKGFKLQLMGLH